METIDTKREQLSKQFTEFQDAVANFDSDVDSFEKALSPLHFMGAVDNLADCKDPNLGDCVIHNDKEFVYAGDNWVWAGNYQDCSYIPNDLSVTTHIVNYQDIIQELTEKVDALSKKAIPRFHCEYCGTQNFEYNGIATTPQCPNCGALMRRSEFNMR